MNHLTTKNQLCITLYQIANKISRLYGIVLAPYDLTFPQYQVLISLWEHGPSTIGCICTSLSLNTSTITPVVKRLQVLGYVDRFRDCIDERRVYVSLTERGLAFKNEALALRGALAKEFDTTLADFVELQRILQGLSRGIDQALSSPSGSTSRLRHQITSTP